MSKSIVDVLDDAALRIPQDRYSGYVIARVKGIPVLVGLVKGSKIYGYDGHATIEVIGQLDNEKRPVFEISGTNIQLGAYRSFDKNNKLKPSAPDNGPTPGA